MPTFIAMLRGINVGANILKMDRLREVCAALGFKNARTYLQSGNVVFESEKSGDAQAQLLEKRLAKECRISPAVIMRSAAEFKKIILANPFAKDGNVDPLKLHVTFLARTPGRNAHAQLTAIEAGPDRFHLAGREVYLHCPASYGETRLSNNAIQKALGVTATTRNWKTVNALIELVNRKTPG